MSMALNSVDHLNSYEDEQEEKVFLSAERHTYKIMMSVWPRYEHGVRFSQLLEMPRG